MPMLFVKCPKTGKPAPTGIAVDPASFKTSKMSGNSFGCPHCGQEHVWDKEDAFFLD